MYLVAASSKPALAEPAESADSTEAVDFDGAVEVAVSAGNESEKHTEIFDEPFMLTAIVGLMSTPAVAGGLAALGVEPGSASSIPLIAAAAVSAPLALTVWRIRSRAVGLVGSLRGRLQSKSPKSTPNDCSVSSPRGHRALPVGKVRHLYSDSFQRGYMDAIYCDYEDSHLGKSSVQDHYRKS